MKLEESIEKMWICCEVTVAPGVNVATSLLVDVAGQFME